MSTPIISSGTRWCLPPLVVVDLEGNGWQPPDIVELCALPIDNGILVNPKTWLVKPEQTISSRVTSIHGIRNEDVAKAPSFDEIRADVEATLKGRYLIAHNAVGDWNVLHRKLPALNLPGIIDTLRLSRILHPGLRTYSLGALLDHFGLRKGLVETEGAPHRAGYDATAAFLLFLHLLDNAPRGPLSFQDLLDIGKPPSTSDDSQLRLFS